MRNRLRWGAVSVLGLVIPLTSCSNNSGLDSIQISPASQSLTVGQSAQLSASGTYGNAQHGTTRDVTSGVSWSSNVPTVAKVSPSGVVSAVSAGTATITAAAAGFNGPVSASATISVTGTGGSGASGAVVSITVIPNAQTVQDPNQTTQFFAIGTTSSGATEDLTGQSNWTSSSPQIATVGSSTGLATAVASGGTTITALYSSGSGISLTGSANFTVSSGANGDYNALSITPSSQALTASGQTAQFIAVATSSGTGLQTNVTSSPKTTWSSTSTSIATVNSSGLVSGVSAGTTTITAQFTNPDNSVVLATATVTVTLTAPPEPILSLSIIPSSITVDNLLDTGQFLAIGTFSTPPYVRDLTNSVTWISTAPNEFPVNNDNTANGQQGTENGGIVSAFDSGSAVIIAEATASDGSVQTATATFNCPLVMPDPTSNPPTTGTCYPGSQAPGLLSTLTVYNEGPNTTNWEVTAPSATGTPNVLHCGPGWSLKGGAGGSVCAATYPVNSEVILTAPAGAGSFGGWSTNCVPSDVNGNALSGPPYWTANGPNYCVLYLTTDDAVGAIFN